MKHKSKILMASYAIMIIIKINVTFIALNVSTQFWVPCNQCGLQTGGVGHVCLYKIPLQITVDTTPPQPGHVLDAEPGGADIDYQSAPVVHASWYGFFDRESGVTKYQYGVHTTCLQSENFNNPTLPVTEVLFYVLLFLVITLSFT